jgi:hypothetical protein
MSKQIAIRLPEDQVEFIDPWSPVEGPPALAEAIRTALDLALI